MSATLKRHNPTWALAAGAVAGMRTMTAPAVVSYKMMRINKAEGQEHPTGLSGRPVSVAWRSLRWESYDRQAAKDSESDRPHL